MKDNVYLTAGMVGLTAASATYLALSSNVKDWRLVSLAASVGSTLGVSFCNSGRPLLKRIFN